MIRTVNRWRFCLIQFFNFVQSNYAANGIGNKVHVVIGEIKIIVFVLYNRGPTPLQQL